MAMRITVQIKGNPSDNEQLRFIDFIIQLDAIRTALSHLENEMAGSDSSPIQYRIVDLRHQSPATVVVEAASNGKGKDISALVVDRFVNGIKTIKSGKIPDDYDTSLLESFRKIGPREKKGTSKKPPVKYLSLVSITTESDNVEIEQSLEADINKIVGPDEIIHGSISGTLELINIHANANTFRIYPVIGPRKVDCIFKGDQLQNAVAGINRYVNVTGALRYKRRDKFPYAVNDAVIEVYPDAHELPTIFDLRGIAPNATGDMASEDFVAALRNATR